MKSKTICTETLPTGKGKSVTVSIRRNVIRGEREFIVLVKYIGVERGENGHSLIETSTDIYAFPDIDRAQWQFAFELRQLRYIIGDNGRLYNVAGFDYDILYRDYTRK